MNTNRESKTDQRLAEISVHLEREPKLSHSTAPPKYHTLDDALFHSSTLW